MILGRETSAEHRYVSVDPAPPELLVAMVDCPPAPSVHLKDIAVLKGRATIDRRLMDAAIRISQIDALLHASFFSGSRNANPSQARSYTRMTFLLAWAYTGNTAERIGDGASFQSADTEAGLRFTQLAWFASNIG